MSGVVVGYVIIESDVQNLLKMLETPPQQSHRVSLETFGRSSDKLGLFVYLLLKVKGKGRALVIAPLSRHCHHRGAQVHGAHHAASHIPALDLPSRSHHSFTDPERMEG